MWKLSEKENFLSELKIKDIKIQQARESFLIEVSQLENPNKIDNLSSKLKEVVETIIRIRKPTREAEMRIFSEYLDDFI